MKRLTNLLIAEQQKRKLTQSEFARLLGVSQPFYSRLTRGLIVEIRQARVMFKIAEITGRSMDEINRMAVRNGRPK